MQALKMNGTVTHLLIRKSYVNIEMKSIGPQSDMEKYLKEKKNLVWHSHNFLLPYITVEEYFIISITFIFNRYFLCFAVDELPAFIIIFSVIF